MTTERAQSGHIGAIKWVIILASLVASLLGARLAAVADAQAQRTASVTIQDPSGDTRLVDLPAIPTAISPGMLPPIAHSRSSR